MTVVGTEITLAASGERAVVSRTLGEGGQGTVYEVIVDDGRALALKWYHPVSATTRQYEAIRELVERGAPNERFLWPLDLAHQPKKEGFGYVMALRPSNYVGLAALVTGRVDISLRAICHIGMELADSYLRLHSEGLCYRDISFGNVFFDPETGQTLICDNDNVGIDGLTTSPVIGTKRFMAPEVVRREAGPSIDTDLYSLSVLLFYLFVVGHPLLGQRELAFPVWNEAAEMELLGTSPLFVFDPVDRRNRPITGSHDAMDANWAILPRSLRSLFEEAFTAGLVDPRNGRVRESHWRAELGRCRDHLASCPGCGALNFYDREYPRANCWNCSGMMPPPLGLRCPAGFIVINELSELTGHQLGRTPYDFSDVIARVTRHPDRPNVWGLTNVGRSTWSAELPDGSRRSVDPGRTVGLIPGVSIDIEGALVRLLFLP